MSFDEFEQLIRQSDPVRQDTEPGDAPQRDPILADAEVSWSDHVDRRYRRYRRHRQFRRIGIGFAAAACVLVMFLPAWWNRPAKPLIAEIKLPTENRDDELNPKIPAGRPIETIPDSGFSSGSEKPTELDPKLVSFVKFVENAGPVSSEPWLRASHELAGQSPQVQRLSINLVGKISEPRQRDRAFELVYLAAGNSRRTVLQHWLSDKSMRQKAWRRLVDESDRDDWGDLTRFAKLPGEREVLLHRMIDQGGIGAIGLLTELTRDAHWRQTIRRSAARLSDRQIQALILQMRVRQKDLRTSTAFILACVPDDRVDIAVTDMVLRRSYEQPAYLVLLSRNTPRARAFLTRASSRPHLSPALSSAKAHFVSIQPQLQQWIADSQGENHVPPKTSRQSRHEDDPRGHVVCTAGHLCRIS